jgi:hypothetical protein
MCCVPSNWPKKMERHPLFPRFFCGFRGANDDLIFETYEQAEQKKMIDTVVFAEVG